MHIPAGAFEMGSNEEEDSKPIHRVRITRPFYLASHEVTQGQFARLFGKNPSQFQSNDRLPVESVTWLDSIRFCNLLSRADRLAPYYEIAGDVVSMKGGPEVSPADRGGMGVCLRGGQGVPLLLRRWLSRASIATDGTPAIRPS